MPNDFGSVHTCDCDCDCVAMVASEGLCADCFEGEHTYIGLADPYPQDDDFEEF